MKLAIAGILLVLGIIAGYQGWIYTEFSKCMESSKNAYEKKEFQNSLSTIDRLRQNKWYKPLKKYPRLDFFELDQTLDYQQALILVELGKLKEAYVLLDRCSGAQNDQLAFLCLYQQGNIALYQGNSQAEKKWQAALERHPGGHDFDTQVNLELLKKQEKKSKAAADSAMLTHRRGRGPYYFSRPVTPKSGPIKP